VRPDHRVLQELERVLEDRLGFLLEALDEQAHRDLRSDLAAGVARPCRRQRRAAARRG
jgi:hypothetical protein